MAKSTCKSEFHLPAVFSTTALLNVMSNVDFVFSSINKDQPKDFQNYLNQKMITAVSTLDGSTLGDNLITSRQVDYMSSAVISTEAVENRLWLEHRYR